jgi:Tfp pilus assembly protein PilE
VNKRRGLTLVEVLITATVTAVLVVALVGLYGFVMVRTMHSYARGNAMLQAEAVASELTSTITNSMNCEVAVVSGVRALKCTLPANGIDKNGDNVTDEYFLTRVRALSIEEFTQGPRVWYYFGDPDKDIGSGGRTILCKAIRNDDQPPTSADVVRQWVFYYDKPESRWSLIERLDFSVDGMLRTATFAVSASTLIRGERIPAGGTPSTESYQHTVSRVLVWRNAR